MRSVLHLGMSTNVNKCQRMSAYEQCTLRMTSVCQRMTNEQCVWLPLITLLNNQAYANMSIYVADTPDIL